MATTTSHNKKSSAVKRILSEAREFDQSDSEFTAHPLEDNIFEWHFTLRGPSSSEFQEGIYHGRILLPVEYPFRPPDVMLLTPNGRWELNKKICLTFTGFHEEMWQPAWGIRTALIGVQAFMGARAEAAVGIGSLDYPEEEREKLAIKSRDWTCPVCKVKNCDILAGEGTRKEERLPEGLTIDPSGGKAKAKESENSTSLPNATDDKVAFPNGAADGLQVPPGAASNHSFGPLGPSDALLASLVEGRANRDAAEQDVSINSSRVNSGAVTPTEEVVASRRTAVQSPSKGKERQVSSGEGEPAAESDRAGTPTPTPTLAPASPPPPPAPVQVVALHNTSEPERRLAVLDRAIATVLFLLLALFLRRVLNALS